MKNSSDYSMALNNHASQNGTNSNYLKVQQK